MKIKGISDQGFSRLARAIRSQSTEPDYGDSPNPEEVKIRLEGHGAIWTDEGWVVEKWINLSYLKLNRLPRFKSVVGDFHCHNNQLTSLEGAPQSVGERFYCHNNQLTSLEGGPQSVGKTFDCSINQLTSLEGGPQVVGGSFQCGKNELTSLDGAPSEINWNFDCPRNQLTSLEGGPQVVGGDYDCSFNQLTSLEGAPQSVGGYFKIENNPGSFTEEEIKSVCEVGGDISGAYNPSEDTSEEGSSDELGSFLNETFALVRGGRVIVYDNENEDEITDELEDIFPGIEIYVDPHPEGSDRGGLVPVVEYEGEKFFYYEMDDVWSPYY